MSLNRLRNTASVAIVFAAVACVEGGRAPTSTAAIRPSESRAQPDLPVTPSSIGWQAQARALAAANGLSPLAAARVYAALGVAQYRAVASIRASDADGPGPANGIGAGGRDALEARRGAVAGASAKVLSFFFPAAAATLEQRVEAEADATPGNVHPAFTRGLAIGRGVGDAVVEQCKTDRFTTPWTG